MARTRLWAWLEGRRESRARGTEDLGRDPDSPAEAWDRLSTMAHR